MIPFKSNSRKQGTDMKTNTQNAPTRDLFPEHIKIEDGPAEPGLYFFTICLGPGAPRLGKISGGNMKPNATGRAVEAHWRNLSRIFSNVRLETVALMPDHVHGIVAIEEGAPHGLAAILRTFKSVSAREINKRRQTPGHAMWQWGHEEHALPDAAALEKMQDHILAAPVRWQSGRKSSLRLRLRRKSGRIIGRLLNRPLPTPAFPQKIHAALRRT
jgi:putative transposase